MSHMTQIGYLGFGVSNLEAWESFGTQVLGLNIGKRLEGGGFTLQMDSYAQRFFVEADDLDDLAVAGWEAKNLESLTQVVDQLRKDGYDVTEGSEALRAKRDVEKLYCLADPAGLPLELYCGPTMAESAFSSDIVKEGFVADQLGFGHLVISARSQDESRAFYEKYLNLSLSDSIECNLHGYDVNIAFFHLNERHHSVAFGNEQRKRVHHFMVESKNLDDVGKAMDRTLKAGLRIMQTIGKHPNDQMTSFYAKTPSGFQFEFGYGGRLVDDATWETTTYDHISEWGHLPPQFLAPQKRK